jgi:hypothetical protein
MEIFARNMGWAEKYSRESGVELEMNEHGDLTEKEYRLVLASGDGAGPSYTSSVLSSRKKKKLDNYKFQQQLLQARIETTAKALRRQKATTAKALRRQKAREIQVARYKFQMRLLGARIKYDTVAVQRQKAKKELAFQQQLLVARIKNDFVRSEMQKGKKKNEFQQQLLGARIRYTANIKKHYAVADEERNDAVTSVDDTKLQTEQQRASVHEKLFESKVDIHFEKHEKKGDASVPVAVAQKLVEAGEPSKMESASPQKEERPDLTASAMVFDEEGEDASRPKIVPEKQVVQSEQLAEVEATITEHKVVPASSEADSKKAESLKATVSDVVVAETPLVTGSRFDFVSSHQGLTGPSKAGLVLAVALAVGLAASSPELDLASRIDWTQPGMVDLAAMSNAAQHTVNDFVHDAQGNLATMNSRLSEMQSNWMHGMHEASQGLMGKLEAAKGSVATSMQSIGNGVSEWQADQTEGLHAASQSLSEWQADNVQAASRGAEEYIDAVKESGASSLQNLKTSSSDLTGMLGEWGSQQK